jgi:dihydrolipoamide dehydrogenase
MGSRVTRVVRTILEYTLMEEGAMSSIVIIGAGPGGYTAAFAAARAGAEVTLVESGPVGGTCLNSGCIPTKTFKVSAEAMEMSRRLGEFGIVCDAQSRVDMAAVVARKEKVGQVLRNGLEKSCEALKITLLRGKAELQGNGIIEVTASDGGKTTIRGDSIIIATGSSSLNLQSLPVDHLRIFNSDDALNFTTVPERLMIVGGGVIGCELAFIYRTFGSKVILVEAQDRLLPLPSVDEELSKLILRESKKHGIITELGKTAQSVSMDQDGTLKVTLGPSPFVDKAAPQSTAAEYQTDAVLVTVGRVPNTKGLGLEKAGVTVDAKGWIIVDDHMRTSAPSIYAVGDVLGPVKIMLAHVAAVEGLCAVKNCLGQDAAMDYSIVPSGIFTMPEIGTVGLSEAEAKAKGFSIRTSLFQFRALGKSQAMGELTGVFKLICDAETGRLLGAHIAGARATDLIAEAALAIRMKATAEDLANTIHAHPTLAEGIYEAALHLTYQFKELGHERI